MTLRFSNAIVVGASSGIGEALARELVAAGCNVALLGRRQDALNTIAGQLGPKARAFAHDVRAFDTVPELFERIVKDLGGLDLIVYASGAMPDVEVDEHSFEKDLEMVEVNVLGAMAWLEPAAAKFTAARGGTIIGISSIAGERGRRGNPAYCATKAAVTAFLEGLRNRCARSGVNVVTIKPGFVDTAMTRGKPGLFWMISAQEAARTTLALAAKGSSISTFVPWRWSLVALIVRMLPSFIMRKLNF
ncbi:MAG: SDR family NAD(P)-dependent oxidoreductase [Deltaproteobacteria bacterium]|nr:SDR family NAD(P)-dependent oxidoreductase [Deltaproteobacteria bacterium]